MKALIQGFLNVLYALLGFVEFLIRVILVVALTLTIVGLLVVLDSSAERFMTPYLWKQIK